MAHRSERDLLVLHTLRCIGFTTEERIAMVAGLDLGETRAMLDLLGDGGLVTHAEGVFSGWGLTDGGRAADAVWVEAELHATGHRDDVVRQHAAFMVLNPQVLKVCHDWQMRGVGGAHFLNDHTDIEYDHGVIDRLARIHESAQAVLDSLVARLLRFSTHQRRLQEALERVDAGDHAYLTDSVDSYHAVWFQLHEDLLTTLGIPRGRDG